jgi:hypothetical protein
VGVGVRVSTGGETVIVTGVGVSGVAVNVSVGGTTVVLVLVGIGVNVLVG